jgi:uncharacterized protein YndB with AHSA1/START domain
MSTTHTTTRELVVTAPAGTPFIEFTREFDAPVAAVFRAHTDPDLVRRWLGPDGYEMDVEVYDVRTGGRYRYVHRNPAGAEFAFNGVFHRVVTDDQIVQTFEYEGEPGVVSIETLVFVDLGGRTRLVGHSTFPSVEARDGIVAAGMQNGMDQGYARLDTLVPGAA